MSNKLSSGDFNYASVDPDTAAKLEYFAKSGKALIRKSQIKFIADMGKLLSEARDVLANHKNGTFIQWATAEFDVDKATVYRYLNVWDRILSQACDNYLHWSQSALYLASAEDFPKPVMKKLEKIPATELVRTCDVKRLIEAAKPKPEPPPKPEDVEDDATDDTRAFQDESDIDVPFDDPEEPEPPQASIMLDSIGKQIPQHLRAASELAIQLQSTGRELDKYRKIAKEFAEQPGGEWLCLQDIDTAIRTLKGHFQGAQYHTVCPRCNGKGCERCSNVGYLPEHRKNIL
jgi:hypothetical protein